MLDKFHPRDLKNKSGIQEKKRVFQQWKNGVHDAESGVSARDMMLKMVFQQGTNREDVAKK